VLRDVLAAVPDDMPPLIHASIMRNLGLHASALVYDKTGKLLHTRGNDDPCQEGYFLRVERAKLRDWLSHNLTIEYGKRLQRFEEHGTGVTAVFVDGTSATGSILVGADGTNSTSKPLNLIPSTQQTFLILFHSPAAAIPPGIRHQ
jgi:flavin-dependent dehydrogenase